MRALIFLGVVGAAMFVGMSCETSAVCASNTDCDAPLVCVADADKRVCAPPCAADLQCEAGKACVQRDDGTFEGACLALTNDVPIDEACVDDRECESGACGGDTTEGDVCLQACVDDADCAGGDHCILDVFRFVCAAPLDDRAAGETCADPRECASGACVERPDTDEITCLDICVAPEDCPTAGDVCVRTTGGARVCLPPLPDGSTCQSSTACEGALCLEDVDGVFKCASPCAGEQEECGEGFVCANACAEDCDGDNPETIRACVPILDSLPAGTSCENARECASGFCVTFPLDPPQTLCADPCLEDNTCADAALLCYDNPEPPNLCGPNP